MPKKGQKRDVTIAMEGLALAARALVNVGTALEYAFETLKDIDARTGRRDPSKRKPARKPARKR